VAVAESASQVDAQSVCVNLTTIGQHLNWYRPSHGSLGDIGDSWYCSCSI